MKIFFLGLLLAPLVAFSAQRVEYPTPLSYAQDRLAPYKFIGQLLFFSGADEYVGSGTVVHIKSVLTAGHNVFDPDTGWSTSMNYRRGNYNQQALDSVYASHLYLLGGYQATVSKYGPDDVRSFNFDTAGLLFSTALTGGNFILAVANPVIMHGEAYMLGIGYGAEGAHTGDQPLFVHPTTGFYSTYGSFWENLSIYIEGGMSGGPLLTFYKGVPYLTGVIVSGSTEPASGGIRIVDTGTTAFIRTYLNPK